jgi:hypothetical protein
MLGCGNEILARNRDNIQHHIAAVCPKVKGICLRCNSEILRMELISHLCETDKQKIARLSKENEYLRSENEKLRQQVEKN